MSSKIANLFERNEISEAFEELNQFWPLPQNELDDIEEKTIKYLNLVSRRFGKPVGNEKIKEQKISDFAIKHVYIVRYEFHAIRLIFTYYKNNNGWIINAFKWDDKYFEEF